MQVNWDEKDFILEEYFSHVNAGRKVSQSGETFYLGEVAHHI